MTAIRIHADSQESIRITIILESYSRYSQITLRLVGFIFSNLIGIVAKLTEMPHCHSYRRVCRHCFSSTGAAFFCVRHRSTFACTHCCLTFASVTFPSTPSPPAAGAFSGVVLRLRGLTCGGAVSLAVSFEEETPQCVTCGGGASLAGQMSRHCLTRCREGALLAAKAVP